MTARIHVIGGSGAGKTTVGRTLAARLGVPFIDLDDLYWDPGWREAGHGELARRLLPQLDAPGWVVAGNYGQTTEPHVWPRITHLVVLDLPFAPMMRRTLLRTLWRGLTGAPCCNGNRESVTRLFSRDGVVRYLARTWRRRHAYYRTIAVLPELAHARVIRLRSPRAVADWLATFGAAEASAEDRRLE